MRKAVLAALTVCLIVMGGQVWADTLAGADLLYTNTLDRVCGSFNATSGTTVYTYTGPAGGYYGGGIALGPNSNVYVGSFDPINPGRVYQFSSPTGALVGSYASLAGTWDLAFHPVNDNLFVTGYLSKSLGYLDASKNYQLVEFYKFSTQSPCNYAFLPSGEFFVTFDRLSSTKLMKFDGVGDTTPTKITVPGLTYPTGITVLPGSTGQHAGNLLICDYMLGAGIVEVSVDVNAGTGTIVQRITQIPLEGGGVYALSLAADLDISGDSLFIADRGTKYAGGDGAIIVASLSALLSGGGEAKVFQSSDVRAPGAVTHVPEPATLLLIGSGLCALALRRRR